MYCNTALVQSNPQTSHTGPREPSLEDEGAVGTVSLRVSSVVPPLTDESVFRTGVSLLEAEQIRWPPWVLQSPKLLPAV